MRVLLLFLPLLLGVAGELPPEPAAHLTPPPSLPLVRVVRNDSSNTSQVVEPQQQEARALVWAAPAIPILSSHRGRTSDCNPCDSVPWVPVARALHTPQYALSIPAIQLTLPVNYGIPVAHLRPQTQYKTSQNYETLLQHQQGSPISPPYQNYGYPLSAPSQKYGPPPSTPSQNYNHTHSAPAQNHNIPPSSPSPQYGPPHLTPSPSYGAPPSAPSHKYGPHPAAPHQNYGTPPPKDFDLPSEELGSPPTGLTVGDSKTSALPQSQFGPPEGEKHGLPPPPLPKRFLSPTYGPPQPNTQLISATNANPIASKFFPHPAPFMPNFQFLPSINFAPSFDPKQPLNQNLLSRHPSVSNLRAHNQNYRDESGKRPGLVQSQAPFSTMIKIQQPPLGYQNLDNGKQDPIHLYLQPPKTQNVVFTITETEDSCKKCQAQSQLKDSEPAPAEHVTENVVKATGQADKNLSEQKSIVHVVKSVPLAEYLASVEYPMQLIQAPILDVPELSKYFDIGYHNFPQISSLHSHNNQKPDYIPSQTIDQAIQNNPFYFKHLPNANNNANFDKTSSSSLDNVNLSEYQDQTTNSIPHNHKYNLNAISKYQTTLKGNTNYPNTQTTSYTTPTTKPSQIFHISKARPSSQTELIKQSTDALLSTTTSGHYVTSQPLTSVKVPLTTSSTPLLEPAHSPSQNYHSTVTTGGQSPTGASNLRPLENGATRDWTYGRVWGNNTPQPFGVGSTSSSQRPRFSVRPTPTTAKKAKHIHQIIVPYTTNKHTPAVQDPTNSLGWTPLPPTNQARKVPPNFTFGGHISSNTGLDQLQDQYKNSYQTGGQTGANFPFSSSGLSSLEEHPIFPTSNGQPMNLPPQVINHILHLNQQGSFWPSGPEGLQQLLVTNLQGLLRGEEDSIDITRLQKNIDNWTAEGYKQNSPSVNFIPVTTMPYKFNSKKIPDEYLTPTKTTFKNSSHKSFYQHNSDTDNDFAESQKLQIKVHPLAHVKDHEQPQDSSSSIESILNSWSLIDTKITTMPTSFTEESTTSSTEPTSKAWEKTQVSISPLTNEKVYVVTPVPAIGESSKTLLST